MLYAAASFAYQGFFSGGVFVTVFTDNAVLGIAAIGMTFVILSGGIDLSVGAVVGFTSILTALLVEEHRVYPFDIFAKQLCVIHHELLYSIEPAGGRNPT